MSDDEARPQGNLTLAERIAHANASAAAARATHAAAKAAKPKAKPQRASMPAPQPTPLASPKPLTPQAKPGKPARRKAASGAHGSKRANQGAALRLQVSVRPFTPAQREAVLASLRAISTRPELLQALQDEAIAAMEALASGAAIPGAVGNADRMALCRLLGLPLHAGSTQGGGRRELVQALGNLERAMDRAHARSRHGSVTIDGETGEEVSNDGPRDEHTHKLGSLVRIADPAPRATQETIQERVRDLTTPAPAPIAAQPVAPELGDEKIAGADIAPPMEIPAFLRRGRS